MLKYILYIYLKGTSKIHLNVKVGILDGHSFLAKVAAINLLCCWCFLVCNHLVFQPICYYMHVIS